MSRDVFVGGAEKPVYPNEMDLLDEPMSPQALEIVLADDSRVEVEPSLRVAVKPLEEIRVDSYFGHFEKYIGAVSEFMKELAGVALQIQSYPQLKDSVVREVITSPQEPVAYFLENISRWQDLRCQVDQAYKLSELYSGCSEVLVNIPAIKDFLSIAEKVEIAHVSFTSRALFQFDQDLVETKKTVATILRSSENLERIQKLENEISASLLEQVEAMTLLINGIAQKEA